MKIKILRERGNDFYRQWVVPSQPGRPGQMPEFTGRDADAEKIVSVYSRYGNEFKLPLPLANTYLTQPVLTSYERGFRTWQLIAEHIGADDAITCGRIDQILSHLAPQKVGGEPSDA